MACYIDAETGPEFLAAPPLSDDDVQRIVETAAQRVVRLLQRRGLLEEGHVDPLRKQEPLLATITAASIQGQVATGERAGQPMRRRLLDPQAGIRTGPLCFASRGSPCMRPPAFRPLTAFVWKGCADTSIDRRWRRDACKSSTPS